MAKIILGKVKGASFTYEDFTPEQLAKLQGKAFTFEDFTPEQLELLKGKDGPTMPISDSVTSPDSGVAASSKAVKTAYDKAVHADGAAETAADLARSFQASIQESMDSQIFYQVADIPPEDTKKLWVRGTDRTAYFHDGGKWRPIVGVYAETTEP